MQHHSPPHVNGTVNRPIPWLRQRPIQVLLAMGVLLVAVGAINAAIALNAMDQLEHSQLPSFAHGTSTINKLLPSILANPSKYLSAVNGNSVRTGSDAEAAKALIDAKSVLDRWMAVTIAGVACLLFAASPSRLSSVRAGERPSTSIASDFAPFALLIALTYLGLSFFEVL